MAKPPALGAAKKRKVADMPASAFEGLRVLDLTHMIAGPYCTRLYALYGADVVKIERPRDGDPARHYSPVTGTVKNSELSPLFLYLNTGKKSVTLNLKSAEGKKIFIQLARQADILVENFRPGVMTQLKIDYDALSRLNPKLVMVSISNFGQTGPYRDYQATELTLQAWGGLMHMAGERGREPLSLGYSAAQYEAGQNAFAASLAALLARPLMGGQYVDIAIMDTVMTSLNSAQAHYSYNQEVQGRRSVGGGKSPGIHKAKDGHVIARLPESASDFERLSKVIGAPLSADDREQAAEVFACWVAAHTKEEVMTAGQQAQFAWGALNDLKEIMESPQIRSREFFKTLDHTFAGALPYANAPFRMSTLETRLISAPTLGQHNQEILGDHLAYTKNQLELWEREGVI